MELTLTTLDEITAETHCYCCDDHEADGVPDHTHRTVVRNLCPHPIEVLRDGVPVRLMPVGGPARVTYADTPGGDLAGVSITESARSGVAGLPAPEPDVYLVVSRDTATACPDRRDLLVPGERARNENGQLHGPALGLVRIVPPAAEPPAPRDDRAELTRVLLRLANLNARQSHTPEAVWPADVAAERQRLVFQAAGLAATLGYPVGAQYDPAGHPGRQCVIAMMVPGEDGMVRLGQHVTRGPEQQS